MNYTVFLGETMTDHEFKFIFIHLAKTGGSSIEHCFGVGDGNRETSYIRKDGTSQIIFEKHHMSQHDYIKTNGREIWDTYFTFSFVRNPWDWFVSQFYWDLHVYDTTYKTRPQKYRRKFIVNTCERDFNKYILEGAKRPEWFKFTSMKNYAPDADFVGRFENIQKDFNYICEKVGSPSMVLPHKKKMKRPPYQKLYNEKTKEIIYNIFKEDINYFNYEY